MNPVDAVLIALPVAALLVAAWHKPTRKAVGGILTRDKKGRLALVLWPAPPKKKGARKR